MGSHGGDGMFSSETASGVMPKAEEGKIEAQGQGQTHAVPPSSSSAAVGKQVKIEEEEDEEL